MGTAAIEAPPRDELFRAYRPGVELRDDSADGPVMVGHFAVFNRWTEIDSLWEGRFLERIAPGAFRKTFREGRDAMRVLFQHGHDPQVGNKPIGSIRDLREDETGAYYEVPLLDARYVTEDVLPGLRAGVYGASFRFRVIREEFVQEPKPSAENPAGLPERTVKEAVVREFGPVTFPAYPDATAGIRSMTDEMVLGRLARDPAGVARLLETLSGSVAFPRALPVEIGEISGDGSGEALPPIDSDDEGRSPLSISGTPAAPPPPGGDGAADTTSEDAPPDVAPDLDQQDPGEPGAEDDHPAPADAGRSTVTPDGRSTSRVPLYPSGKETPAWLL